jgi:hypothetical protein
LPKVAYHGMAYFIFLKYLDSLEDFRKNPHVKIPPKSPYANFQSLDIFKTSIFNQKRFFFNFRPNRPSGQPAHPAFRPTRPKRLSSSSSPMVGPTTSIE